MDLQALVAQLSQLAKNLNPKQRIVIIASVVAVGALIVFLVVFNSNGKNGDDGYRVLFDGVSPKDAGLIVAQLEKDKVPYKIPSDGTIEVPENLVNKERLAIAAQGIPKDSRVGFELFDKQEFGSTDFDQKVKYMRALEGELAKTIESIAAVQRATVHIAQPKDSVFVEKEIAPTASVVIELKPGMVLTPKQVIGVKNLTAAAVPKLTVENVKLVNENGDLLGDNDADAMAGELAKTQMKYKKDYEKAYEEKIVNVLAPLIGGSERVVAKVTIDFDFSQKNSTSETFDPNSVVRSEQTNEEKKEGYKEPEIGGVPGAVSNIGPVQGIQSNNIVEKYSKAAGTTNYEISKTTANVKGEFATIKRITAAVAVDGKYEAKKDAKGEATEELAYAPLDAAELEKINALVRQSIGTVTTRGDEVAVTNFQFKSLGATEGKMQQKIREYAQIMAPATNAIKWIIVALILFGVYRKLIVPFAARIMEIPTEELVKAREIDFEEEEIEDSHGKLQEMKKRVEQQLGIGGSVSEESLKYEVLLEKVRGLIEEKTEEVATLLETLVADEAMSTPPPRRET